MADLLAPVCLLVVPDDTTLFEYLSWLSRLWEDMANLLSTFGLESFAALRWWPWPPSSVKDEAQSWFCWAFFRSFWMMLTPIWLRCLGWIYMLRAFALFIWPTFSKFRFRLEYWVEYFSGQGVITGATPEGANPIFLDLLPSFESIDCREVWGRVRRCWHNFWKERPVRSLSWQENYWSWATFLLSNLCDRSLGVRRRHWPSYCPKFPSLTL